MGQTSGVTAGTCDSERGTVSSWPSRQLPSGFGVPAGLVLHLGNKCHHADIYNVLP